MGVSPSVASYGGGGTFEYKRLVLTSGLPLPPLAPIRKVEIYYSEMMLLTDMYSASVTALLKPSSMQSLFFPREAGGIPFSLLLFKGDFGYPPALTENKMGLIGLSGQSKAP